MKKSTFILTLIFIVQSIFLNVCFAQSQPSNESIEGKWDITVMMGSTGRASWLEIKHSGIKTLVGHFVGDGGSARPISQVFYKDGKMSFHIPPQWENNDNELYVEGELKNGKLIGTMKMPNGNIFSWEGVRAPKLWRDKEPVWGTPIQLFNGKNLNGWNVMGENQWIVENGVLKSPHSGSNIKTEKTFSDFKLHIEFKYPQESNSGVYLRGRYEVQSIDCYGQEPSSGV